MLLGWRHRRIVHKDRFEDIDRDVARLINGGIGIGRQNGDLTLWRARPDRDIDGSAKEINARTDVGRDRREAHQWREGRLDGDLVEHRAHTAHKHHGARARSDGREVGDNGRVSDHDAPLGLCRCRSNVHDGARTPCSDTGQGLDRQRRQGALVLHENSTAIVITS
ncbi:hypothetical protein TW95_gp1708 [Pandoravirus inopinatum]|uniref:Uncharacterized protein n=1 Tax=Pandoravirus inopinatum TaxID=1605721 RepID=A0A0B5JF33_9VIRU|nr:hypothetical protein TW95_gp1708 [Pandoravirus inopinatum]AJF98442.1 hypothetical protein [Pandoravirus inopinatum]